MVERRIDTSLIYRQRPRLVGPEPAQECQEESRQQRYGTGFQGWGIPGVPTWGDYGGWGLEEQDCLEQRGDVTATDSTVHSEESHR